jgi:GNAT superfamily N-acetyltransferase
MLSIRPAQPTDAALLKTMIHEFASFERLPAVITEADILRDAFGPRPRFRVLIAEWNSQPAGYAFFFDFYSSFHGRHGLFLEDIYVRSQFRGKGIGYALFARVAAIARQENCFSLRWQVLAWNTPAVDFYKKLDAEFLDEWKTLNLEGDPLERLAKNAA